MPHERQPCVVLHNRRDNPSVQNVEESCSAATAVEKRQPHPTSLERGSLLRRLRETHTRCSIRTSAWDKWQLSPLLVPFCAGLMKWVFTMQLLFPGSPAAACSLELSLWNKTQPKGDSGYTFTNTPLFFNHLQKLSLDFTCTRLDFSIWFVHLKKKKKKWRQTFTYDFTTLHSNLCKTKEMHRLLLVCVGFLLFVCFSHKWKPSFSHSPFSLHWRFVMFKFILWP